MLRGHAEALLPMLQRVMQQANFGFSDIDRIAVTTGPGSFTGLRVGIAAARGLALAAEKPAVGLSTLSAYAAPHMASDERFSVVGAATMSTCRCSRPAAVCSRRRGSRRCAKP